MEGIKPELRLGTNSTVIIQDMAKSDILAAERLLLASPTASQWSAGQLAGMLSNGQFMLIAREDAVIGLAAFRVAADEAELLNIAVASERRRCGIGKELLREVTGRAERAGAQSICLEVRRSNQIARDFYGKLGFQQIGVRKNYYRNPNEDALILSISVRSLKPARAECESHEGRI